MNKLYWLLLLIFITVVTSCNKINDISPVNLQCEYLINPLGIDVVNPRFLWQMTTAEQGATQTAFKIFVGTDSADVAAGKGNIWESGVINSHLLPAVYMGPKPAQFTRYYWTVKTKNNSGWSPLSAVSFFETGMMGSENWRGDWITDFPDYNIKPAPYFRKVFELGKKVKTARAYIAAGGLYELHLNGEKVGDHLLDPMYTRYDRRVLYVTYDVTQNLIEGKNALGILLGNGWYNYQSMWRFNQAPWRSRPKFCFDLRIVYEDGSEEVISSDTSWKTTFSPIIFNSIYTGEHYDARQELPGWNTVNFNDLKWKQSMRVGAPTQNIESQALHPIRFIEELPVADMSQIDSKTYLFNFGRNISGFTQLRISGLSGTKVKIKYAERVDEKGRADQSNVDVFHIDDGTDPFQTDIYILSGNGEEIYTPRFSYKGFQYVEVSADQPILLSKESLKAIFLHNDVPVAGSIHSSNPTLNKIWEATNASYLSNLFGLPTDCPTREKSGWTNDAHISIETGLYNFDLITIYEKWLKDHLYEQQPNGALPAIVPSVDTYGFDWGNGVDITSSIAIIPWNIYLFYGDPYLLKTTYDAIKRYVNHIDDIAVDGLTDWGLGDWVPVKSKTGSDFTSSVYFYVDAVILTKAAKLFGHNNDFERYSALALKIKNAINQKYFNENTGIYGNGYQTELSMALYWGLVPENLIPKVAKNLEERVLADDSHIDVGEMGSKTILNALSENGYADLAYQVATQETYPSWGWWIVNGATTLYEYWPLDAKWPDWGVSMNHHMFGEVSAWFYKGLGGIYPDPDQPGFKNIILKPNFVSGLNHFEATHNSPYGKIVSSWKKNGEKILYTVSIPPNSNATLYLKANKITESDKKISENNSLILSHQEGLLNVIQMKSGQYSFTVEL